MSKFQIAAGGFHADAESICLCAGQVQMKVPGNWSDFACRAEDYQVLWNAADELELNDVSLTRAMAPHLVPEGLRDAWTLRAYVGPNAFGQKNVLLDPLPTKVEDVGLSMLLAKRS